MPSSNAAAPKWPRRRKPHPHILRLHTDLGAYGLRKRLRRWEPWAQLIDFSNGVSTADFKRRDPFNTSPLRKLAIIQEKIPFDELKGGSVLDVGCNEGHNSIAVAQQFGMRPVGIDVDPRHIATARFLGKIAGIEAEFRKADAERFIRKKEFDVVLHFGTLYHLENPLLSLRSANANLKPGGYLALETQCYDDPENWRSCYFLRDERDRSNWWAFSTRVVSECLEALGFEELEERASISAPPPAAGEHMRRVIWTARKG